MKMRTREAMKTWGWAAILGAVIYVVWKVDDVLAHRFEQKDADPLERGEKSAGK